MILTFARQTVYIEAVSLEAATDVTFARSSVATVVTARGTFWSKTHMVNLFITNLLMEHVSSGDTVVTQMSADCYRLVPSKTSN